MGLFDKKYCDFCGDKIGLFGNRKLSDGNMCKKCASFMSSLITDRKQWTVAEMKEHLDYRQKNNEILRNFKVSDVVGRDKYKLYIDQVNKRWFVSEYNNYVDENADVFSFDQVRGSEFECRESRSEIYYRDANGHNVSFEPREYDYDYDFYVTIYVDCAFTDRIQIKLNSNRVDDVDCVEYHELGADCEAMKYVLDNMPAAHAANRPVDVPRQFNVDPIMRNRLIMDKREKDRYIRERRAAFERMARNNGRR